jgi:hypothetical protein
VYEAIVRPGCGVGAVTAPAFASRAPVEFLNLPPRSGAREIVDNYNRGDATWFELKFELGNPTLAAYSSSWSVGTAEVCPASLNRRQRPRGLRGRGKSRDFAPCRWKASGDRSADQLRQYHGHGFHRLRSGLLARFQWQDQVRDGFVARARIHGRQSHADRARRGRGVGGPSCGGAR